MGFIFLFLLMLFNLSFQTIGAQPIMALQETPPKYLYKIISLEDWEKSMHSKGITLSPIDKEFIHLAKEEQITHVVEKYWPHKNYVLLKLVSDKLKGCLVYETNSEGQNKYYHLYDGGIFFDAVLEATVVKFRTSSQKK